MLFHTDDPDKSHKSQEAFAEEVTAILENLSAIDGKEYASVVSTVFTIQNIHTGLFYILAETLKKHSDSMDLSKVKQMVDTVEQELVHDMAHVLIPILLSNHLKRTLAGEHTPAWNFESCSKIVKKITGDVALLTRKQDEYNLGAKQ